MQTKTYSNPQTTRTIENWPFGSMRTTAMFYVETDPKRGQRACRRTVDPKNGRLSAPKKLTFADRMRIADGSDGRTYIIEDNTRSYDHITVMQSNMKLTEESIYKTDPRFP
ncbi:MAG TPA: hypothetical protein VFG51_00120, partial [Candidatus Saccharimonadia bacterium]|nr:hypothetical protein [Candidatus Saccharimonadia bacterium]